MTCPLMAFDGVRVVHFYGYQDCLEIANSSTRVVLCPAAGGRVLVYALDGKNVLYLPSGNEGWIWDGQNGSGPMHAGRFDIGPELVVPRRQILWQGKWTGEITGDREVEMTSQYDPGTGVRLKRKFFLNPNDSTLQCTQTILNESDRTVEYCHWSRTFAVGKGICIVPLSDSSRMPQHYVRYDPPGKLINVMPTDPHVERMETFLVISDHPENPKLGFDSTVGWFAYLSKQDLLFVKRFPTYPDRVYNELAGLTISIWYPDNDMVELEPIGPRERLEPKQIASFTETWQLVGCTYRDAAEIQPQEIATIVAQIEN